MADLLRMRHPDIDHADDAELPVTTRAAFDTVWQDKGWTVADDVPTPLAVDADADTGDTETARRRSTAKKG